MGEIKFLLDAELLNQVQNKLRNLCSILNSQEWPFHIRSQIMTLDLIVRKETDKLTDDEFVKEVRLLRDIYPNEARLEILEQGLESVNIFDAQNDWETVKKNATYSVSNTELRPKSGVLKQFNVVFNCLASVNGLSRKKFAAAKLESLALFGLSTEQLASDCSPTNHKQLHDLHGRIGVGVILDRVDHMLIKANDDEDINLERGMAYVSRYDRMKTDQKRAILSKISKLQYEALDSIESDLTSASPIERKAKDSVREF